MSEIKEQLNIRDTVCGICVETITIPARLIQSDYDKVYGVCKCERYYCLPCVKNYVKNKRVCN